MVHLGFIFALGFLVYPASGTSPRWSIWIDCGPALLGVASVVYALVDLDRFIRRSTLPEPLDLFFGISTIVLLLELSRRAVDKTLLQFKALVKRGDACLKMKLQTQAVSDYGKALGKDPGLCDAYVR